MTTTTSVNKTNDFNKIALERRSIKSYDPTVKISREEMNEILTEATRAPSSINFQPWKVDRRWSACSIFDQLSTLAFPRH